ncbi:MAG: type VI secretion system contractile sheath large subunit, partial [Planctomycetia bacterium]
MDKLKGFPMAHEGNPFSSNETFKNIISHLKKSSNEHQFKNKSDDLFSLIQYLIAKIDLEIEKIVNQVLHLPAFMKLEASWRGIWSLTNQLESDSIIKIKILSISWDELSQDFSKSIEFDQSSLFQKIYSDEFGTPGGEPYGLLLGDFEIGNGSPSQLNSQIRSLEQLSMIASAAFCPMIYSVSPSLFNLESFQYLGTSKTVLKVDGSNGVAWNRLRKHPDSRFLGLLGSKVLYRTTYRKTGKILKNIIFNEKFGFNGEGFPFGTPIYAFGILAIKEFLDNGWFSGLRGSKENMDGMGLISHLPHENTGIDSSSFSIIPPLECMMTPEGGDLLDQNGIMTFTYSGTGHNLILYNCKSAHLPDLFESKIANENASISSLFNYILCVSRFAHFIKVIGRDKLGSFKTPEDCETFITSWLYTYTDSGRTNSRKKPLKSFKIQISDDPSKPGSFKSVIHLEPHLQVDHISATIKLVTNI